MSGPGPSSRWTISATSLLTFVYRIFPDSPFELVLGPHVVTKLARNYAECRPGELFTIEGSSGYLEISTEPGIGGQEFWAARPARRWSSEFTNSFPDLTLTLVKQGRYIRTIVSAISAGVRVCLTPVPTVGVILCLELQVALLALVLMASAASAQVAGRLSGSVVDQTGAAVPGASVNVYIPGGKEPVLTGKNQRRRAVHLHRCAAGQVRCRGRGQGFRASHAARGQGRSAAGNRAGARSSWKSRRPPRPSMSRPKCKRSSFRMPRFPRPSPARRSRICPCSDAR